LRLFRVKIIRDVLLIAAFGAAGATSRYGVGVLMQRLLGDGFVYGTLAVNLTGCFLLGFVWHTAQVRQEFSAPLSAALGIGFLGALTTYSTFGLETFLCLEERRFALAGASVAVNLLGGLLLVWAGVSLARYVIGQ
jgi:fluoride exporter